MPLKSGDIKNGRYKVPLSTSGLKPFSLNEVAFDIIIQLHLFDFSNMMLNDAKKT